MADPKPRLAVLIDSDNVQSSLLPQLMAQIATLGEATVRRAYGNWAWCGLANWEDALTEYSIQAVHLFRTVENTKNASDMQLVIGAMDILHRGGVDGFCIVSSDSDFTPLCARLRKAGMKVYRFGEEGKKSDSFTSACDKYFLIGTQDSLVATLDLT